MKPRVQRMLVCGLAAAVVTGVDAIAAPPGESVSAFLVTETTAGDLNGDGDATDVVVHLLDAETGATLNLRLAVPQVCDPAVFPAFCSPVQPVAGDSIVAFLVSEAAQGARDLDNDGDALDDVLFVYDGSRREVRSTELAVAHGTTRSVSFITFPIVPAVLGDVVVFLVAEGEQGTTDLNHDGDKIDAVVHLVTPKKHKNEINVGLAAPRIGFFQSPALVASGDGSFVTVLAGEREQDRDLNRDGDLDDTVLMEVRVQNGKARPADADNAVDHG